MKERYTVGEFSELFGVHAQTLRYYDSIKLFQPAHRDERTSRRQYSFDQVYGLAGIRFLRQIGYSLDEVQDYMNHRETQDTLEILKKRSDDLRAQIDEMHRVDTAIRRKITYTEEALREVAQQGGAKKVSVRNYAARRYLPIGVEELLYHDKSFYLYPTVVFYEGEIKSFGAFLYGEEKNSALADADGREPQIIEAGAYLCGYHRGSYETVFETEQRLRTLHPTWTLCKETTNFNIIDQFMERNSENYLTAMQIKIENMR